jgi:hypothetical protein
MAIEMAYLRGLDQRAYQWQIFRVINRVRMGNPAQQVGRISYVEDPRDRRPLLAGHLECLERDNPLQRMQINFAVGNSLQARLQHREIGLHETRAPIAQVAADNEGGPGCFQAIQLASQ